MNVRRDTGGHEAEHPSLVRIGAFSDAVFAFAITLLILAIRIPHPTDADADQGLFTLLTREWRSYLAFVLSFMLVGINWANHRVMFKTFARADQTLVWLNLLYLMVVAFTPSRRRSSARGSAALTIRWSPRCSTGRWLPSAGICTSCCGGTGPMWPSSRRRSSAPVSAAPIPSLGRRLLS
jgi:hypothetical protein